MIEMKTKYILVIGVIMFFLGGGLGCDKNNLNLDREEVIGNWQLIKAVVAFSPNSPSEYDYSQYNIIYQFTSDGKLIVSHNNEPDNIFEDNFHGYDIGEYVYEFIDSEKEERMLEIKKNKWWFKAIKDKLILDQSPLDGATLYFIRL